MDKNFKSIVEGLHNKYEALMTMSPVTVDTTPNNCPVGGIYLFSENGEHLYAGRTKRKIKTRLNGHVGTAPDSPFAWHLAREATGHTKATYQEQGSRKHLLSLPYFVTEYQKAKDRIRKMEVRYVEEPDPLKQALLEIYVAVVSGAKYNDFDTH